MHDVVDLIVNETYEDLTVPQPTRWRFSTNVAPARYQEADDPIIF